MKKVIANAPLCVSLCTVTANKEQNNKQPTVEIVVYSQDASRMAEKIAEEKNHILHKIYTDLWLALTRIWLVLSPVEMRKEFIDFQVATS